MVLEMLINDNVMVSTVLTNHQLSVKVINAPNHLYVG